MDQLIRETQPPAGTLRSPVPQYWNPDTEKYERVLGVHGAPRAMLYGSNGQPISTSNRLPVDVGAQVATESTLAEAVSRLNAILMRLEGTLDVDVGGQIHADVDLGDVTVQIGEVQQGKRGQNAEPWEVTLKGSLPAGAETIGGVTFQGSRNGEIEYLLNAVSVPPGGNTGYVPLDYKGCRKVILGVQSSQPWKIDTNTSWGSASDAQLALFSITDLSQVQDPVTSIHYPHPIVVGYRIGELDIQEYTLAEVLGLAILPPNLRVRVENLSPDSVSTVSVRIMRIW